MYVLPMPKRAVFERSCRELSLDVSVGVHTLLVVEQSSLESQSRGCAKTPMLTIFRRADCVSLDRKPCFSLNLTASIVRKQPISDSTETSSTAAAAVW